MTRFLISLTLLIAALVSAVYLGGQYQWFGTVPTFSLEIIFFLGISTAVIFYLLIRRSGTPAFTQAYLLSIVLKMLVSSAFILVVIFRDRSGAFENALLFIVSYFLFTALEVGFLFKRINR